MPLKDNDVHNVLLWMYDLHGFKKCNEISKVIKRFKDEKMERKKTPRSIIHLRE